MMLADAVLGAHHGLSPEALNLLARTKGRQQWFTALSGVVLTFNLATGWMRGGNLRQEWIAGGRGRLVVAAICVGFALLVAGLGFGYVVMVLVGAVLGVTGIVAGILRRRSADRAAAGDSAS